jgi:UDP-N-acetylmuramoyl-L-alanyl-D-glutamate--2,6-diaminopimelate ligase
MNSVLEKLLSWGRRIIPQRIFRAGQPVYHWVLSFVGALMYRFPSRHIKVVGITGTKGKSTTVELVNAILEEAGYTTAVFGTIRFKIGNETQPNLFKMTMPGRFFVQKFLRKAVNAGCEWVVMEMTSQGVLQSRHRWINLDAFIFTNLSPEHIESHGSYEKYRDAKLTIAKQISISSKKDTALIINADDAEASLFLAVSSNRQYSFSLTNAEPYQLLENGFTFTWHKTPINSRLPGIFNLYNMLAAATFAESQNISADVIKRALERISSIRGRVEFVTVPELPEQRFDVVVDYAHTIDSLEQFYTVFKVKRNICILGNTGGGRDAWKRPQMARVAQVHCEQVILRNEDPYDEDPQKIIAEMAAGITDTKKLSIIMDRREAIREALHRAEKLSQDGSSQVSVLITGKGTDPYIMGPRGNKQAWDDATVVREELNQLFKKTI